MLKTIGMIGGMSWESMVTYYQMINGVVKKELGGLHSVRALLYSADFAEIEQCQADDDWEGSEEILAEAARSLEKAGVDFIIICTNIMHKVVPQMQRRIQIPILHIAEATVAELLHHNIRKVALLGTKYTMTQKFYKEKLTAASIGVLISGAQGTEAVNDTIYRELCLGTISDISREKYLSIIGQLAAKGAQGAILGCMETGFLIQQEDASLPVFDTTQIHTKMAAMETIG